MPVAIQMRGELSPVMLDEPFRETIDQLNMSASKGMEFVISRTVDGDHIAVSLRNILSVRETNDDD